MKKRTIKSLLFLIFLLFSTILMYAIPANPNPVVVTQPDGKELTVLGKGDERVHWCVSLDGYTLLHNKAGYLSYAQLDEYGNLQPTDYIATDIENRDIVTTSFLHTLEKNLFFSDTQIQVMHSVWEIEDEAYNSSKGEKVISGEYKTICAFVQFPEESMQLEMSSFESLFNQLGYTTNGTGSVRDFFREVSYGKFDLVITLCGVYTTPQSSAYYAGSSGSTNVSTMARWAAQQVAAEPSINFEDYDINNSGIVEGFHIIFAGRGQESSHNASDIWSHKSSIYPAVYKNGKRIEIYSCSPELSSATQITTIGVVCHEMTHALGGIRDYYDTNDDTGGSFSGTGSWDLMANGSWNSGGNSPAHPNMHVKAELGWVTPVVLNAETTVTNMPNAAENPIAYRINTATYGEYYLLENRQKVKFDKSIPGEGLIIYHVSADWNKVGNCINCTHPQKVYPVCASRSTQMPGSTSSSYGNINTARCPFPGAAPTLRHEFTDDSTPAMRSWKDVGVGKPITNIKHENKLISFDFMEGMGTDDLITDNTPSLQVVPNPANEYIDLQFSSFNLSFENINFYNFTGQLVKSVPCNSAFIGDVVTQRISITDLSKGLYFITVGKATTKLLVQ